MLSLKKLVEEAHRIAREHGWWEKPQAAPTLHMLMVSEIAEATEEARKGTPAVYFQTENGIVPSEALAGSMTMHIGDRLQKPEGELVELADAIIRIADYCGSKGWDLEGAVKAKMHYNETRSYRHGNKKF
jgi:NTP pyrophosphatase (non-canonical NTP hydrolase)